VRITAVNLQALAEAGWVLDTPALALMQSLGDWHMLNAVRQAAQHTEWISARTLNF